MKKLIKIAAVLAIGLATQASQAAEVVCGNASLGIRVTMVDPGLTGGLCWATNGNLDPLMSGGVLNAGGTLINLLEKDVTSNGSSDNTGKLGYTGGGGTSGTWSLAYSNWQSYSRLFLGFHFGGGGNTSSSNPDSFVVELAPTDLSGTWALGPEAAKLNGLSNIYVFGKDPCVNRCGRPPQELPEPGSLALAGFALLSLAALRRKNQAK